MMSSVVGDETTENVLGKRTEVFDRSMKQQALDAEFAVCRDLPDYAKPPHDCERSLGLIIRGWQGTGVIRQQTNPDRELRPR